MSRSDLATCSKSYPVLRFSLCLVVLHRFRVVQHQACSFNETTGAASRLRVSVSLWVRGRIRNRLTLMSQSSRDRRFRSVTVAFRLSLIDKIKS
jgi:hypothetical protein